MKILMYLSNIMIPLTIFYIVGYGISKKRNVYEDFIEGAKEGLKTVVKILPTLIGLMVGVGILRASGFLDMLGSVLEKFIANQIFPSQLIPLVIVRMFSSSAATGLVLDIFKENGPDSRIGMITSIMMGCTETIFYTMSVYFMAAKVQKSRWTLAGALTATFVGIAVSVLLVK